MVRGDGALSAFVSRAFLFLFDKKCAIDLCCLLILIYVTIFTCFVFQFLL